SHNNGDPADYGFLQPSVAPSLHPWGGRFDASFRIFRERHGARATKIPSGVPPGPAGVVLVNTFFWKILVTRVNGKIRHASGFIRLAPCPRPVMRGLDPRIHRKKGFFQGMDCRVKPGNDDRWVSADAVIRKAETRCLLVRRSAGLISLRREARYILCRWPKAPRPSRARTSSRSWASSRRRCCGSQA